MGSLSLYPAFGPFVTEYSVEHEGAGSAIVTATPYTTEADVSYHFVSANYGISYNTHTRTVTWDNADFYRSAKMEITVTHDGVSTTYFVWLDNVTSV